tara:strand:+ start:468 stop:1553 length:1086 start_codon:yes stop_codon:yes gene_type:complete
MKLKKEKEIFFYYPILEKGGLLATLVIFANYFCTNYKIKIFTSCSDPSLFKKFNKKIDIINIKKKNFFYNRILRSFFVISSLSNYINKNTIIFSLQDHLLILLINKIFFKKKIIIRTSSIIPNGKNILESKNYKNIFLKKLIIRFYRLADHVITFSNDNVKYFKKIGIYNTSCIYNFFKKQKKIIKLKKNKKLNIFFIGRLTKDKNPIFFLKNLINIKMINIYIVGSGSSKKMLENISENNNNVFFYNYTENPFKKFKKYINLLCITSRFEGTPNIMGEAMSYGIPVLAPKEIGLTKLFLKNGKIGYLYKLDNSNSFQQKINEIIKNYSSASKKAKMAYNSISRFNYENTLNKIDKIISKF